MVLLAGLGMFFKDRTPQPQPQPVVEVPPVATVTPPPVAPPGTAHLSVVTPVVVKVSEGKQDLGTSPLELDLSPGPHTLRLSNKVVGIDQTLTVTLEEGQPTTISELGKGLLVVKVEPWAYVKLDGKQLGQTPIPARQVYEGVHLIELNNTNLHETRRFENSKALGNGLDACDRTSGFDDGRDFFDTTLLRGGGGGRLGGQSIDAIPSRVRGEKEHEPEKAAGTGFGELGEVFRHGRKWSIFTVVEAEKI